jgi:type IV secretion system protein VirB8
VRFAQEITRTIKIKSISIIDASPDISVKDEVAQVRIMAEELNRQSNTRTQRHFVITISYGFKTVDLSLEDKYINPLGFLVTNYRTTEENIVQ